MKKDFVYAPDLEENIISPEKEFKPYYHPQQRVFDQLKENKDVIDYNNLEICSNDEYEDFLIEKKLKDPDKPLRLSDLKKKKKEIIWRG